MSTKSMMDYMYNHLNNIMAGMKRTTARMTKSRGGDGNRVKYTFSIVVY